MLMEKYNLEPTPFVLTKIHQIYEMILVRHGFMIVGDPLGGKTKDYQLLAEALTLMGQLSTSGILEPQSAHRWQDSNSVRP